MQDWKRQIPTIMTAQELLDRAYARASRVTVNGAAAFDTVKKTNIGKITAIGDMTTTTLLKYVRSFPRMEKEDEFYSQLIDVIIGHEELKKALVNISWCTEKCSDLQRKYLMRVRRAPNIDEVAKATKEFYGRFSSVINRVGSDLLFCQKARDQLRQLPAVDTTVQTVVIAGYPNVGKSQLVERISSAKPTIAPYPFTTKGVVIGHIKSGWRTYQVIDTPGLLDRELEKRNAIELQAILALKYLADVIVFLIDPSETCGYTLDRQLALLESVKGNFTEIPFLEVDSKADLEGKFTGRPRVSALTGEGVDDLLAKIEETLKGQRVNDLDKLPT
jgi:nucleolar GTP-binding protein